MRMNKKLATGLTAGVIVLAGSGVALAYWTASGSGSGSASTSTGAAALELAQTSTIDGLHPGGEAQAIAGTVTNGGTESAYVTSVTVTIAGVDQASGAVGGCDATDYVIADEVMTVNAELAAGDNADFSGATINFVNKTANQDGCKGATVNLAYTAA